MLKRLPAGYTRAGVIMFLVALALPFVFFGFVFLMAGPLRQFRTINRPRARFIGDLETVWSGVGSRARANAWRASGESRTKLQGQDRSSSPS
jgi:hypothetical protein